MRREPGQGAAPAAHRPSPGEGPEVSDSEIPGETEDPGPHPETRIIGWQASPKRRRPSGDPAPLPRVAPKGLWIWMGLGVTIILVHLIARSSPWVAGALGRIDDWLFEGIPVGGSSAVASVAEHLDSVSSDTVIRVLRWIMIAVLLAFQRWRHLFTAVGSILAIEWLATSLPFLDLGYVSSAGRLAARHALMDHAVTLAGLTVTLIVIGYSLLPRGRWRTRWFAVSGTALGLLSLAAVYVRNARPFDAVSSVLLGAVTAMAAFHLFVPDSAFPVTYTRTRSAHLDVGGARNEAIRRALQEQLLDMNSLRSTAVRRALMDQLGCGLVGCDVAGLEPFALAGSAGSTPLLMQISGDPSVQLFGKLYATTHLRSDRWYKLGRAITYGALEDEAPFNSVRRLVEYEDYMLRVMRDGGIPAPQPHGFVEITPHREYLLVTEFITEAEEIDRAEMDETIINNGVELVRHLWDADLAHRDIKPANLLVQRGKVVLIDVAFATQRPSPWRQAVDLANMMLTLALRSSAAQVYEHAQHHFAEEDIAEAFAATRAVTIPRQLRTLLRERQHSGQDLIAEFRDLAPPADPIKIQRWSVRRLALITAVISLGSLLALVLGNNLRGAGFF